MPSAWLRADETPDSVAVAGALDVQSRTSLEEGSYSVWPLRALVTAPFASILARRASFCRFLLSRPLSLTRVSPAHNLAIQEVRSDLCMSFVSVVCKTLSRLSTLPQNFERPKPAGREVRWTAKGQDGPVTQLNHLMKSGTRYSILTITAWLLMLSLCMSCIVARGFSQVASHQTTCHEHQHLLPCNSM